MLDGDTRRLAETVRAACIAAAERAYEEGGVSGMCSEGRWELAVQAMRELDLDLTASTHVEVEPPSRWRC
jgi:hypothetical protein